LKNLILVGEIISPSSVSTIDLYDSSLNHITPDSSSIISSGVYKYTFELIKSVLDSVTDNIYYLKVFNEMIKCEGITYNTSNSFSFSLGSLPVETDKSWLKNDPVFLREGSSYVSKVGIDYTELLTSLVLVSGENVVEWFSYSQGIFQTNSSLEIGSGILFCWVLKKKSSSLVNVILFENLSKYKIEIIDDQFVVNNSNFTTLFLSETFTMFSIWISTSQIKTWQNRTLKDTISI